MGIGLNFLFPPCMTLKSNRQLGFSDGCHMSPPVCFNVHPAVVFEVLPGCLGAAYVRAKGAPRPRVLTLHLRTGRNAHCAPLACLRLWLFGCAPLWGMLACRAASVPACPVSAFGARLILSG